MKRKKIQRGQLEVFQWNHVAYICRYKNNESAFQFLTIGAGLKI